jgi:formate dehydrogenase
MRGEAALPASPVQRMNGRRRETGSARTYLTCCAYLVFLGDLRACETGREAEERQLQVSFAPLERLLAESDWVVPQLPGGAATRNFIDRARLAQMKPGACLVNISRADVVDRDALIEALRSGRLGGFALDPLYEAPGRSNDELLGFKNVVLSPHIAAQPRFNALNDIAEMIEGLARAIGSK